MQSLQLKSHDNFKIISGYASVFNNTDEHNDMIAPGAFAESLRENRKIVFLWQHMVDKPIGVIEQIREDDHGLYNPGEDTNGCSMWARSGVFN